ncbi:hypothetical protein [Streptomyces radicis]|uniref:hypothetical protein n=1 Tax=Streptomyces radicis TaxID=1750517 RepID=UPI0016047378|nr:hypothetical protein [Streptomyces radicis]
MGDPSWQEITLSAGPERVPRTVDAGGVGPAAGVAEIAEGVRRLARAWRETPGQRARRAAVIPGDPW